MLLHLSIAILISFAPSHHHQDKNAKSSSLPSTGEAMLLLQFSKIPLKTTSLEQFPNTTPRRIEEKETKAQRTLFHQKSWGRKCPVYEALLLTCAHLTLANTAFWVQRCCWGDTAGQEQHQLQTKSMTEKEGKKRVPQTSRHFYK